MCSEEGKQRRLEVVDAMKVVNGKSPLPHITPRETLALFSNMLIRHVQSQPWGPSRPKLLQQPYALSLPEPEAPSLASEG